MSDDRATIDGASATATISTPRRGLIGSIAHRLVGDAGRPAGRRSPADIRWRDRLAQLRTFDARRTAWPRRPRRLLDVHLHQLAAHGALSPRVGCEVPRPGLDRDRCSHARIRLRGQRRQRRRADAGLRCRIPGRDRHRLRGLAGVREPFLARRLHRGRRGPHPLPPLRRGRVRHDGDGRPATAARGGRGRRRPRSRLGRPRRASRSPPTGAPCEPPRPTSASVEAPASRLQHPLGTTNRTTTPSLHDSASTSGPLWAGGRSRRMPRCWMQRRAGSPSGSRRATSTS